MDLHQPAGSNPRTLPGAPLDGICQNRYAALRSRTFGLLTNKHSICMTTLVKIHRKGQMTLPTKLRSLAGISEGDLVEAAFQRGKIVLTPKLVIDRSRFPTADEEYTPAQRRIIDARLAKSDEDIKHDRTYGPFNTAEEMAASIEANIRKLRAAKKRAKPAQ
jgi:AbrB family looped-hinge helix DNA binding protein